MHEFGRFIHSVEAKVSISCGSCMPCWPYEEETSIIDINMHESDWFIHSVSVAKLSISCGNCRWLLGLGLAVWGRQIIDTHFWNLEYSWSQTAGTLMYPWRAELNVACISIPSMVVAQMSISCCRAGRCWLAAVWGRHINSSFIWPYTVLYGYWMHAYSVERRQFCKALVRQLSISR
jgi:hypothetical protein